MRKDYMNLVESHRFCFAWKMILAGLLLNILANSCSEKEQNPPLAKFKGDSVSQNEYIDHYLLSTQYKPTKFPSEDNLKEIVVLKAMEKIALIEAKARKLDNDSTYREITARNEARILFYRYVRQQIIDTIITDSLIHKFYAEYTPQYQMRYIIRPVLETSSEEFEDSQKDTIELVYQLLRSGKNFEELAKRYSQDITTKDKGGDLGFVIRESLGDAKLRAVMDTLRQFTYSKPFRGFEGYYILYAGEKREVPVPAFSKVKDRIWQTLYRTRRHLIKKYANERLKTLAPEYHYQINQQAIDEIKIAAGGNAGTSEYQILNFQSLSRKDMDKVIAEYDGGKIRTFDLFENRKRAPDVMYEFRERLQSISQQYIFAQHARELGFDKISEVEQQIAEMKNAVLRSTLYQKVVTEKAAATIDSLEEIDPDLKENRLKREQKLKADFEEKMKEKYHFRFITQNFNPALEEARKMKEKQNQERGKNAL